MTMTTETAILIQGIAGASTLFLFTCTLGAYHPKLKASDKAILYFIWASLCVEFFNVLTLIDNRVIDLFDGLLSTGLTWRIYTPVELITVWQVVQAYYAKRMNRAWVDIGGDIFVLYCFVLAAWIEPCDSSEGVSIISSGIIILILMLYYFYYLLNDLEEKNLLESPVFWFSVGQFMYTCATFFFFIAYKYLFPLLSYDMQRQIALLNVFFAFFRVLTSVFAVVLMVWHRRRATRLATLSA